MSERGRIGVAEIVIERRPRSCAFAAERAKRGRNLRAGVSSHAHAHLGSKFVLLDSPPIPTHELIE